jgi:GrpB-like predicted nucleotidyltransferase (UPF0157 family)
MPAQTPLDGRSAAERLAHRVAASIDHVGSTAVPGLAAKSVIDIDVLLRSFTDLQ